MYRKILALSLALAVLLMGMPCLSPSLAEEAPVVEEEPADLPAPDPEPAPPAPDPEPAPPAPDPEPAPPAPDPEPAPQAPDPQPDPPTPEPVTPEPVTPEPVTPEPVTPEPVTPEPVTPESVTPEPVTPEPATPEPVTPEPVTPEPVTPEPVTPEPVTPEPVTPEPATPEPATPEPATPEPATPEPATPEPATPTEVPEEEEPTAEPTPEPTPEPTEEPAPAVPAPQIDALYAPGSAIVGYGATFTFSASNASRLEYLLIDPDGDTADSGTLGGDATSYSFTPTKGGTYTLRLTAIADDGVTAQASASVSASYPADVVFQVEPAEPCCHAGDPIDFRITGIDAGNVASCRIEAFRDGELFYESPVFADKITVVPPAIRQVCDITVRVSIVATNGHTGYAAATIPCAYHDRETQAQWEATVSGVNLTGVWPDDLIAIAFTQLGYHESTVDFGPKYSGGYSGYTRYGDWWGLDYEEWCAMFVGFCMRYADIPSDAFPFAANCQRWINAIQPLGLYASRDSYEPKVGDLVFFEWTGNNDSDHIGIIYQLVYDATGALIGFYDIEGNHKASVSDESYYSIYDSRVMGYGLINEAYARKLETENRTFTAISGDCVATSKVAVSKGIPGNVTLTIDEVKPEDARYDALTEQLEAALSEEEQPLNRARFFELRFVDDTGAPYKPTSIIPMTIRLGEAFPADAQLQPGVAIYVSDDSVLLDRAVVMEQSGEGTSFFYNQSNFTGVIGLFVSGETHYEDGLLTCGGETYRVEAVYDAAAGIPSDTTLTAFEYPEGSLLYNSYMSKCGLPEGAVARFFNIELRRQGQRFAAESGIDLSIYCDLPEGGVSVMQIPEEIILPSECATDADGQTAVSFRTNMSGVIVLFYVPETTVELTDSSL